jgi:phosphate transport system permease protein
MTDAAFQPVAAGRAVGSASDARVRKRYAAERRFRLYGIGAIAFAAAFIVFLVSDIVLKGYPAFTEHRLTVTLTPTLDRVAEGGKTDRETLMRGDWMAVVREGVGVHFPEVSGRVARGKLYNELISSGSDQDIRNRVIANPSLIGTPVNAAVLLSDDADLYFKGSLTRSSERVSRSDAKVSGPSGDVTITTPGGDFTAVLADLRSTLGDAARRTRLESARVQAGLATADATRTAAINEQVKRLNDAAAELERRSAARTGSEKLTAEMPSLLVRIAGGLIKVVEIDGSTAMGTVLTPLSGPLEVKAGGWSLLTLGSEGTRKLSDQQVAWLERMKSLGLVSSGFATRFFTSGDSREPELAGILGSLTGSALTMLVTLLLCLPIGVAAAIYLEEFAPKNRLTDLVEVNINNLAAVPSIVFGLLGLAIFLNTFNMPRSSALVGGLVLALLVLPTIIISSRAALKAVPPSIREAALGLGASHQQAVFHHVLPLAMPGILTGTIIGMAHALGETAPLLMIGMVAFIIDVPTSMVESATALPVQIFLWSDLPEAAFQAKTAGAIMVLLLFLFAMNGAAIWLRRGFERRW